MPTSLTYILLSTRGSAPWRPAAVSVRPLRGLPTRIALHRRFTGHRRQASPGLNPARYLPSTRTPSPSNTLPVPRAQLQRKDISPWPLPWRRRLHKCCHALWSHSVTLRDSPQIQQRGNLNPLPFRGTGPPSPNQRAPPQSSRTSLPAPPSGPTHPWPIAVPMEPSSTSVFNHPPN